MNREPTSTTGALPPGIAILPGDEPQLCPELLTIEEAIRYLRLNEIDIADPAATIARYRRLGLLRATQVGKAIRFRRCEIERFLAQITEANPR